MGATSESSRESAVLETPLRLHAGSSSPTSKLQQGGSGAGGMGLNIINNPHRKLKKKQTRQLRQKQFNALIRELGALLPQQPSHDAKRLPSSSAGGRDGGAGDDSDQGQVRAESVRRLLERAVEVLRSSTNEQQQQQPHPVQNGQQDVMEDVPPPYGVSSFLRVDVVASGYAWMGGSGVCVCV